MLPLRELQSELVRGLVAPPSAVLLAAVEADGFTAADRLQVYANHFRHSLVEALGTTFPVVKRLLGEPCFTQVAGRFARCHPPRSPCLFEYGRRLPGFLATQSQLAGLPWLSDTARLEWALNEARHAIEHMPAARRGEVLAAAHHGHVVVSFAPSARFLASPWPVDQIWRANQGADEGSDALTLEDRGVRLLIHRDADNDIAWLPLPRPEFSFARALAAGHSVARAAAGAAAIDSDFNAGPLLHALVTVGAVIDACLLQPSERSFR